MVLLCDVCHQEISTTAGGAANPTICLFPCFHKYCERCKAAVFNAARQQQNNSENRVNCKICNQNFRSNVLFDYSESHIEKIFCLHCNIKNKAPVEWKCKTCQDRFLCSQCSQPHYHSGHEIEPVMKPNIPLRSQCSVHVNMPATYLCSCQTRLCDYCLNIHANGQNTHPHEQRVPFTKLAQQGRLELENIRKQSQHDFQQVQRMKEMLDKTKQSTHAQASQARTAVANHVLDLVNAIIRRGNDIVTSIDLIEDGKLKHCNQLEQEMRHWLDRLRKVESFTENALLTVQQDHPGMWSATMFAQSAFSQVNKRRELAKTSLKTLERAPKIVYQSSLNDIINAIQTFGLVNVDGEVVRPAHSTPQNARMFTIANSAQSQPNPSTNGSVPIASAGTNARPATQNQTTERPMAGIPPVQAPLPASASLPTGMPQPQLNQSINVNPVPAHQRARILNIPVQPVPQMQRPVGVPIPQPQMPQRPPPQQNAATIGTPSPLVGQPNAILPQLLQQQQQVIQPFPAPACPITNTSHPSTPITPTLSSPELQQLQMMRQNPMAMAAHQLQQQQRGPVVSNSSMEGQQQQQHQQVQQQQAQQQQAMLLHQQQFRQQQQMAMAQNQQQMATNRAMQAVFAAQQQIRSPPLINHQQQQQQQQQMLMQQMAQNQQQQQQRLLQPDHGQAATLLHNQHNQFVAQHQQKQQQQQQMMLHQQEMQQQHLSSPPLNHGNMQQPPTPEEGADRPPILLRIPNPRPNQPLLNTNPIPSINSSPAPPVTRMATPPQNTTLAQMLMHPLRASAPPPFTQPQQQFPEQFHQSTPPIQNQQQPFPVSISSLQPELALASTTPILPQERAPPAVVDLLDDDDDVQEEVHALEVMENGKEQTSAPATLVVQQEIVNDGEPVVRDEDNTPPQQQVQPAQRQKAQSAAADSTVTSTNARSTDTPESNRVSPAVAMTTSSSTLGVKRKALDIADEQSTTKRLAREEAVVDPLIDGTSERQANISPVISTTTAENGEDKEHNEKAEDDIEEGEIRDESPVEQNSPVITPEASAALDQADESAKDNSGAIENVTISSGVVQQPETVHNEAKQDHSSQLKLNVMVSSASEYINNSANGDIQSDLNITQPPRTPPKCAVVSPIQLVKMASPTVDERAKLKEAGISGQQMAADIAGPSRTSTDSEKNFSAEDSKNITTSSPDTKSRQSDRWDDYCYVCSQGCDDNTGLLGCCDTCTHVFHAQCHVPRIRGQMEDLPDDWRCTLCLPCEPLNHKSKVFEDREKLLCAKVFLACFEEYHQVEMFLNEVPSTETDYHSIIKRPIWLTKIAKKISNGKYAKVSEFVADMNLLFQNFSTFHQPAVLLAAHGKKVYGRFVKAMRKHLPAYQKQIWLYVSLYNSRHTTTLSADEGSSSVTTIRTGKPGRPRRVCSNTATTSISKSKSQTPRLE